MIAVNLWKPHKLQSRTQFTDLNCKWRFVRIAEKQSPTGDSAANLRIWSTPINIFSAPFSSLLHRIQIQEGKGILKGLETHYTTIVEGNARSRWEERLAFRNKERGKSQRVTVTRPSAA